MHVSTSRDAYDRLTDLNGVPDGYCAMNDREGIKVMIQLWRVVERWRSDRRSGGASLHALRVRSSGDNDECPHPVLHDVIAKWTGREKE